MGGPDLIARSISACRIADQYGNEWQYHSRSDRHSKIACWTVAFDLLERCELLREHFATGKVVLGVNHTLRDFQTRRKKDLDLVIAQPAGPVPDDAPTFVDMASRWDLQLTEAERAALRALPRATVAPVGSVLVALEAKATMTAHVKALPRLHDELDSSHSTTHGNSERALAIGFIMVNAGEEFLSPDMNKFDMAITEPRVNVHRQPQNAERVIAKVGELRRRSGRTSAGFDALGIMVIGIRNDGSAVRVLDSPDPVFTYDEMVGRIAHEYASAFARL